MAVPDDAPAEPCGEPPRSAISAIPAPVPARVASTVLTVRAPAVVSTLELTTLVWKPPPARPSGDGSCASTEASASSPADPGVRSG